MPKAPDISLLDTPVGPLRDKYSVTVGTDDIEIPQGFICQVGTAGDITYRTLAGSVDQVETALTAGTTIGIGNHPVLLRIVRGSSTVTSIIVGRL